MVSIEGGGGSIEGGGMEGEGWRDGLGFSSIEGGGWRGRDGGVVWDSPL